MFFYRIFLSMRLDSAPKIYCFGVMGYPFQICDPFRSSFICSIICSIHYCNSSWDIPWIPFFLHSLIFCLPYSDIFWCLFLTYLLFDLFLLQIILSINHEPFFVTFFYFLHNTFTVSFFAFLCFFAWYQCCLVIVPGVLIDINIINIFFIFIVVYSFHWI